MDTDQFVTKYNGTHIDEDGYYGAQCWDVVARYAREVVGCPSFPTGSGGAEGLFRLFQQPIPQYFDRIANNPNDPNQLPQKGDVIVWQGSFSPPYGHTALCISAYSGGVTVLEQNGNNPGGVAYIKQRNWVGVAGWLRPKKGAQMAGIPNEDNWFWRYNKLMNQIRGRGISQDEFKANFVGVEPFHMVEILSDSDEADSATADQTLGKQAREGGWQDKITALSKQVSDDNATLITLQQQVSDLGARPTQQQLDDLNKAVADANTKAMAAQADLEKLQAQSTADQVAGDSFLRRLGQFISKYLGK